MITNLIYLHVQVFDHGESTDSGQTIHMGLWSGPL
jgi:hypothetical protein